MTSHPELEYRARKAAEDGARHAAEIDADLRVRRDWEQRARQRQIATRLAAARAAIDEGRLLDAIGLLDQVRALAPELDREGLQFAERSASPRTLGRRLRKFAAVALPISIGALVILLPSPRGRASLPLPPPPSEATERPRDLVTVESEIVGVRSVVVDAVVPPEERVAETASPIENAESTPLPIPAAEPDAVAADSRVTPGERERATPLPRVSPPPEPPPPGSIPDATLPAADVLSTASASLAREEPAVPAANAAVVSPVTSPVSSPVASDDAQVRATLDAYRTAYDQLDSGAARAVWPTVDARALSRAFGSLESQSIDLGTCAVDVRGAAATATCRGTASYVTKIGGRERQAEPRQWHFNLRRIGERWTIVSAITWAGAS